MNLNLTNNAFDFKFPSDTSGNDVIDQLQQIQQFMAQQTGIQNGDFNSNKNPETSKAALDLSD